ncbi:uncharacterized protein CDV56_101786 [Aspergillus thermomutatus]|uniref:tRNA nucleotidyltransferase/poly(A) polymerase RNA and SrmB- binding domain-containing protein n=1 Tax=Aspergillus thermomutatus TaxID=41047 RepID=A0A397GAV7_ASPTH|nr:uncharacterized protein CDV56_101786 [Aspergillus thermomutatus]RHZ47219.1 hypothetical protein CDV56_101786 [Aspergillus thermomutatus]
MNAMRVAGRPKQLCTKVSRERVETELMKILKGPNTLSAFQLIHELHLYDPVFLREVRCSEDGEASWLLRQWQYKRPWQSEWARAFETVAFLLNGGPKALRDMLLRPEKMDDIWMLTAFVPLNPSSLNELAERQVKVPGFVSHSLRNYVRIWHLMREVTVDRLPPEKLLRGALGLLLRLCGSTWRLQVLYALLKEDFYEMRYGNKKLALIKRWSKFVECITEQRLEDAPYVKPILNGHDIMGVLRRKKRWSGCLHRGRITMSDYTPSADNLLFCLIMIRTQ